MFLVSARSVLAATVNVSVATGGGFVFTPSSVSIQPGDTVKWTWEASDHSVTSGTPDNFQGIFNSGILKKGATFSHTFSSAGSFDYFCQPHGACCAMVGNVTVGSTNPTAQPLNISTRLRVQTGDNVMIGGFIVSGTVPKKLIIRAIGPSLLNAGIQDFLADPTLELHDSSTTLATNDNWKTRSDGSSQQTEIEATPFAPKNDLEAAILTTLPANNAAYTAIVSGKNGGTGIGLVEVYDLDQAADAKLANISTRGLVQTGDNVMIGGFILGGGTSNTNVIVRAIGPFLTQFGINGALADPTLELHDSNGALLRSNDNWKTRSDGGSQEAEIQATGLAPKNDLESAIMAALPPGAYTAIVGGKNNTSGVGLVEVYRLP